LNTGYSVAGFGMPQKITKKTNASVLQKYLSSFDFIPNFALLKVGKSQIICKIWPFDAEI
jgi:hypothetical protein